MTTSSGQRDEHRPGVKRGAFPVRQSELDGADPFVPGPTSADGAADDSTTPDTEGATTAGPEHGVPTP